MSLRYVAQTGESRLVIGDDALKTMLRFRQIRPRDKEAGGQLFARFNGPQVVIEEATPPTILDYRARYGFRPNRSLQRRAITKCHRLGLHFVGDWHTHPENQAKPSYEDISGMKDCFKCSIDDLTAFVMIIVGIAPPPEGWYIGLVTVGGVQTLCCELEESVSAL